MISSSLIRNPDSLLLCIGNIIRTLKRFNIQCVPLALSIVGYVAHYSYSLLKKVMVCHWDAQLIREITSYELLFF